MTKLNRDVLLLIFQELEYDPNTLFSCLLVNKAWCEIAVPVLWKNPWRYNVNYGNKIHLFYIITLLFINNINKYITNQLYQIPTKTFLFNYLSFCRSIDINIISVISTIGSHLTYNQFFIQEKIINILLNKCDRIKYLDMRSIKHQIFYFPNAKIHLKSLHELICDTTIDFSFFYGFSNICNNIENIIVINRSIRANPGLIELIRVQQNLKYFEWRDELDDDQLLLFEEPPYEEIFLILKLKKDTLLHLKMYFLYIFLFEIQEIISELINLRTLVAADFCFFSERQLPIFKFKHLETLQLDHVTFKAITDVIKNSGGALKDILMKHYDHFRCDIHFDEDSLTFIRTIYEHCPSVECLSLLFPPTKEHIAEFEKLLKRCKNLKSVLILISNVDIVENEEVYGKELLEALSRSAPANLREIRFVDDLSFPLKILESFLESWRNRSAISIYMNHHAYEGESYMNLLNKYKIEGVIKNFKREFERDIYYSV